MRRLFVSMAALALLGAAGCHTCGICDCAAPGYGTPIIASGAVPFGEYTDGTVAVSGSPITRVSAPASGEENVQTVEPATLGAPQ